MHLLKTSVEAWKTCLVARDESCVCLPPQDKMDEEMQRLRSDVRSMAAESEKIREILLVFAERQSGIAEVLDDDHRESWNSP